MAEAACSSVSSEQGACDEGLCRFKCHCWDEIDLVKLVAENVKPDWWMNDFRICYRLLNEIFDYASRCEGNQEKTSRAALLTLDASLTLPSYMKNLKRTAGNNVSKKPHSVVAELYKETDQEFVGPECQKNGITRSVLNNILKLNCENESEIEIERTKNSLASNVIYLSAAEKTIPCLILSNRLVLELDEVRNKMRKSWKEFLAWVLVISLSKPNIEEKSLRKAVERLREKKQDMHKHQQADNTEELLNDEFKLPQKRNSFCTSDKMDAATVDLDPKVVFNKAVKKYAAEIESLVSSLEQSNSEVQLLREAARELSLSGMSKAEEVANLRKELAGMKQKHTQKSEELQKAMEKLGTLSTRNVNKKIKRRDELAANLKEKTNEQKEEIHDIQEQKTLQLREKEQEYEGIIDEKNEIIINLNSKLDAALAAKSKSQKLKWYYKDKAKHSKHQENEGHLLSKISELKSRISELENDVETLQEKIENFLELPSVKTFQDGKYTDEVRTVYEDLLCWGVGVENVVLGMSEKYQQLLKCFEMWSVDATPILKGEGVIFKDIPIKRDDCLEKIIAPSPFWDAMTLQVLELMFGSFVVVTKRMLSDHLEGGKYHNPDPVLMEECKSAPKSNVTPERDFGMLDRLVLLKPNATTMVYEGILLFTKNNTKEWRDNLSPEKRKLVMQLARNSKQSQRHQYIERKGAIRRRREEKLAQAKQEKEKRELKERVQKEDLIQKVEELGGLWKTAVEVDEKLEEIVNEKEKKVALRSQLQFRKIILGATHPDKTLFQMSTGGKQFTSQKMASNLKEVIIKMDEERKKVTDFMTDNCDSTSANTEPVIVSREKLEEQKQKYKELAEKEEIKSGKKRSAEELPHETRVKAKRKKPTRHREQSDNIPTIVTAEDLVGKKVTHYCVGEDQLMDWFEGTVVGMHGGNRNNPDFLIRYVGFEELFLFSYCEFEEGKVKLVPLTAEDLVGKRISQRFEDEKHKQSWWENGKVLSISDGSDKDNPEFIVEFDYEVDTDEGSDSEEDICTDSEVCSFNLFEDYLNNDLRLP